MPHGEPVSDIQDARRQHQASSLVLAKRLLALGVTLFLIASALPLGLGRLFALDQHDTTGAAGLVGVLAVAAFVFAAFCLHDSRPIPDEPLHAPRPLDLNMDQPWRSPTRLRFLEKLKRDLTDIEQEVKSAHESAVQAYHAVPRAVSYSDYRSARSDLQMYTYETERLVEKLPPLYERIGQIFSGEVGGEILSLKEATKKAHREKEERQRVLTDEQGQAERCTRPREQCESCQNWLQRKASLYAEIHRIDNRVIEQETDLEELLNFDFQELWKGLNYPGPANLARVPADAIADFQEKVNKINAIPDLQKRVPAPRQPSREEQRQQKRAESEAEIGRLERERDGRLKQCKSEPERRRWENFYDDAIREKQEDLRKWL